MSDPEDVRKKLDGLMRFAYGVLTARDKVPMSLSSAFGAYHEGDIASLPGVHIDCIDGAWLIIDRLRETKPPNPANYVVEFLDPKYTDPDRPPSLQPAISKEVAIEEASDLTEAKLLRPENVSIIVERGGQEVEDRVRVTLLADDCLEMKQDFQVWRDGPWAEWALNERPIRQSIELYKSLFRLHSAIHAAESVPPELVWGIGIGRWKHASETIDMPIFEQLLDIEVEANAAITLRPRDLPPTLSLKPYLQIEVPGADKLQNELQQAVATVLKGETEFSPFSPAGWEHILATAAARLSEGGIHVTRRDIDDGTRLQPPDKRLTITSTWVFYGRPRSSEARAQDIDALRRALVADDKPVPDSIRGFVAPEPDKPEEDFDKFGLKNSGLPGTRSHVGWTTASDDHAVANPDRASRSDKDRRAHFFPLSSNEQQLAIINHLDKPEVHVVTVTGPPGTGKTHTIANIVGHFMATGKRVLVTARTPEAIGAVREKLPERLRKLVVAAVGTDRESAQQLRDAMRELSDEVLGLDVGEAERRRKELEGHIVDCEKAARDADRKLADIARENLEPLEWDGRERSVMDLAIDLESQSQRFGWFSDRPNNEPPAQFAEALLRLKQNLPRLAPDIAYAGVSIPEAAALPTAEDLVAAHQSERDWNARDIPDYSDAPTMARDTADADAKAQVLLRELEDCAWIIATLNDHQKRIVTRLASSDRPEWFGEESLRQVTTFIDRYPYTEDAAKVRFELGDTGVEDLLTASERGAAGGRPVSVLSSLFGSALTQAVASVTLDGRAPILQPEWRAVHAACTLQTDRPKIEQCLAPLRAEQMVLSVPHEGWEIARYLIQTKCDIEEATDLASRLATLRKHLSALFPFGLDLDAVCRELRVDVAIRALRANLPDGHQEPAALTALDALAGDSNLPLFRSLRELRQRLGTDNMTPPDIVSTRNALTKAIQRLERLKPDFAMLSKDLETLASTGVPEWAERLRAEPLDAADHIPEGWEEAWAWGMMKGRVDRIIEHGNGDDLRKAKAEALRRRGELFEELIHNRTMLGLYQRMSSSVRRALQAFTDAVSGIGAGTGMKAPRLRLAAQQAAKQASSAAPAWIMPEYKIPEQLPPTIGDFDLVILDEASQSDITALAPLFRGKTILIVGDEEQVSPSNVGYLMTRINVLRADCLQDLPNADLIDENTSIFQIARRMHPDTHVVLTEHFRSVAPIIQFSTQFYASRLVPLRIPKASERFDPPLVDVYVQGGRRQGKTNQDEARYIVEEIANIISDPGHKARDIGVISLIGSEQADKLQRMLMEDPRVGTEIITERRIICGDARTMQGQERSIVFLSMVAEPGNAHAQTKKEDQQRINVAMSRARDRLYLVRSVTLDDLNPADIKAKVLRHFLDPMPEGRNVVGPGTNEDPFARCQSGFERDVLGRLLDANYRVRPQVKVSSFYIDLVVEGTEDRRLAIELDGDQYHGPEVWERDMARQAALERAGWTFWRVFGSQWHANKEYWWQHLRDTLARMGIEPIGLNKLDERFTEFRIVEPFSADRGKASAPYSTGGPKVRTGRSGSSDDGAFSGNGADYGLDWDRSPEARRSGAAGHGSDADVRDAPGEEAVAAAALPSTPRVVDEPVLPGLNGKNRTPPAADPSRFYEPSYRAQIAAMAVMLMDAEGPITFKQIADRIARAHGFQRTGKEIKRTVWAACYRLRRHVATPDGHKVFWPKSLEPREEYPFRGLEINGDRREWRDVPYPEKVSVVRDVMGSGGDENLVRSVADRIGIGRVTKQFCDEIEVLSKHVNEHYKAERIEQS